MPSTTGVVARVHRLDQQTGQARPVEHVFHQHRAAEQRAEMQRQDGHHRHQRIAQHVMQEDARRRQALGARRADVVALDTSSTEARVMRNTIAARPSAMVTAGIESRVRCCRGDLRERDVAAGRRPAQGLREDQHHQRADHEDRDGEREARRRSSRPDRRSAAPTAANSPAGNPMSTARSAAAAISSSVRGRRCAISRDRVSIDERSAEIAAQQAPHAAPVLRREPAG